MISIAFANVAGGRFVDSSGAYVDEDRTADFARALAGLRPDVLIVTELDPSADQLERLTATAMPDAQLVRHGFSDSHIPGVARLGVGIASSYPLTELERIDLPNPSIDFRHWRTGKPLVAHGKGFLVVRGDFGALGEIDIVGGQVCPIHMFRSAEGIGYTYREGPGRKAGEELATYLREEFAARGVQRAIVAGDLNMPNPGDFFGESLGLIDAFGNPPPSPPRTAAPSTASSAPPAWSPTTSRYFVCPARTTSQSPARSTADTPKPPGQAPADHFSG